MKTRLTQHILAALGAVIVVSSVAAFIHSDRKTNMVSSATRVTSIFEKTRTVCVGRFVLEIPATATLVFGGMEAPYETYRLKDKAKNVDEIIAGYVSDLEQRKDRVFGDLLKDDSMLGKLILGPSKNQRVFFDVSPEAGNMYEIKSLTTVGSDLYLQSASTFASKDYYTEDLTDLNEGAARLAPLGDTEIPTESGFCIDGALVHDTKHYQVERIQVGVRLKEFPDVHFSLEMVRKSRRVESDALEPRLKEAEREAHAMGMGAWHRKIKTLRRGERILKPWTGYEVLAHLPAQKLSGESHQFNFVAIGEPKNVYIPTIDMALDTGVKDNEPGAVKPSITDEEAVYLWDRLTNSLRVRPVSETPKQHTK